MLTAIKETTGHKFPENAWEQLWGAIGAVFGSWQNERAIYYRQMNGIPNEIRGCTAESLLWVEIDILGAQ